MLALETLDRAVEVANTKGTCDGWTLQREGDGYAAWLYVGDVEDCQISLFDNVDVQPTAEDAANWCLQKIESL